MYDNGLGKYLLKIISLHLFAVTFIVVFCSNSNAATYYVCGNGTTCNSGGTGWSTGNNSNACTSKSAPCLTIVGGKGKMSGGDTLIVGDGNYSNDPIKSVPSGSAGAYTVIKTENVGGATIDMSSVTGSWVDTGISLGSSYVQVEGFRVRGNPDHNEYSNGVVYMAGNHNKLIRIAAYDAPKGHFNMQVFSIAGSYNLVEECWTWGYARYKFLVYQADHTIVRRCVARHDYMEHNDIGGWAHQQGLFVNYDSSHTLMQNNIGIDSDYIDENQSLYGAFWDENNQSVDKSGKIEGSIALNIQNAEAAINDRPSGTRNWTNVVIWDSDGGFRAQTLGGVVTPHYTLSNLTIGNINGTYPATYYAKGAGVGSLNDIDISISDSIIYDAGSYGITDYMTNDYIALYGNGTNYHSAQTTHTPTGGAHNITNVNPLTNCLKYLPRIESTNCSLKTAGSTGGHIGAEILYKIGVDGALYGETGYDTLTSNPLWPFPNEARIKSDFASYSGPGPVGARGFAASGKQINGTDDITLTSYIWEYLGNQMPADIYASSPVNGVCGANNGGSFTSLTSSNANNCSSGTVTNFSGTGPWTWYCAGSGGGTNSPTCSASLSASQSDTTAPSVSITTSSPQSITTNSLTVTGSASDTVGVTSCKYRIGAAPNASNGTACTGTTSWSCSTSGYSSDANTLYVGCSDGAGNWPSSPPSITVNYTLPTTSCTYYVRPDGHNTASGANNTSNISTGAWLTLQHAADTVVAGDTVCVADGTYSGFMLQTSGTSGNRITFKALGTGANITSRNPTTTDDINIEDWGGGIASYITIDGFNVSGATRMGIRAIAGTEIIIQNNTIHNNADCGILSSSTPGIQVLNNTLYTNGSTTNQHNIYISNAGSDNAVVRGNISYSAGGGNGVQLNGDYLEGGDGYIDNAIIEDNIFFNNAANGIKLISCRYATVRNNITYGHSAAGGVHISDQFGSHYSTGNVVVNNTLDETGVACVRINSGETANVIFNNICIGSTGIAFEGSGNYQSNNYRATTGGSSIFSAYSNHNYTLLSTSPAKDYGVATYQSKSAPTVDFLGNARPQGTGYDAGAYEFGSLLGTINTLSILNVSPD